MSNSIQINNITSHTTGGSVAVNNLIVSGSTTLTLVSSASYASTASYAGNYPQLKTYIAKLSQTSSQNPTVTTITNTLGFEPTWSRIQQGVYYFNFSQSVDYNKVVPFISPNSQDNTLSTTVVNATTYSLIDNIFSMNVGSGFDFAPSALAIQPDGKTIVVGNFNYFDGNEHIRIIRLDDGTYDNTFSIGSGFDNTAEAVALQSDGKIITVGIFTEYNGTGSNRIARLNTDGTYDNTFNIGTGFDDETFVLTLQPDEKIIAAGIFTAYNGTGSNHIARLNTDGTYDNTFNVGSGFGFGDVQTLAIQSNGKIVVGGSFLQYNGTGSNRIARLNTDGTYDNTFNIGTGFDTAVSSLAIQPDGKIIAVGDFSLYNGTGSAKIARLNSNGTYDNTFNIGGGFNDVPITLAIQSDGKILVGGQFDDYNGNTAWYIARLNTDGTYDTTFNISGSLNSSVTKLAIQPDKKIVAIGNFSTYIKRINPSYDVVAISTNAAGNTLDGFLNDTTIGVTLYS